jgi:bla regulator protein BlaR1
MNAFWETIVASSPIRQIGWTLIHSLWIGLLIAALLAGAEPLLRRRSASARYLVACAALFLFITSTTAAFSFTSRPHSPVISTRSNSTVAPAQAISASTNSTSLASVSAQLAPVSRAIDTALPWLCAAWLLGITAIAGWQISAWRKVRRIKRSATPLLDSIGLVSLARSMHIRHPVALLESAFVKVPTLIGWLSPAILLPVGLVAGLSPLELRAILAHELAHVRRHDYLVNLLQSIVQTLFFFNPAVAYISARMRFEREACCDDIVLHTGVADSTVYAQSLLNTARRALASSHPSDLPIFALAAVGHPSDLRRRIQRLLGAQPTPTRFASAWPISFLMIAALSFACMHNSAPLATAAAPAVINKAATPNDLQIRLVAEPDDQSETDELPDPGSNKPLRLLKPVLLDGRDVARAYPSTGHEPAVGIDLTDEGGKKLKKITSENINHRLAIIVNGKVLSAPTIRSTIAKSLIITAGGKGFTPEQVEAMVNTINNSRPAKPDGHKP